MAEAPIRFAKGSAVWCQTTPVNYHDAVVLEDCVEGDAEAVVRYTTAARVMRVAVDKVIPIGDARPRRSTTKAPVPAVSPARGRAWLSVGVDQPRRRARTVLLFVRLGPQGGGPLARGGRGGAW